MDHGRDRRLGLQSQACRPDRQQRKAGERYILYVEGFRMLNQKETDGLVEGVHCNSRDSTSTREGWNRFLNRLSSAGFIGRVHPHIRLPATANPW